MLMVMLVIVAVVVVLVTMFMIVTMIMLVVMIMVVMMPVIMAMVIMRMIVAAAAIGTVHVFGRRASRTARLTPGNRLGHQAIFFRQRIGMMMPMVMMVVVMMVIMPVAVMIMVVMIVIMRVIMALCMIVPMIVMIMTGHAAKAIGPALGLKRRRDKTDLGPELLHEFDEHIVVADAKRIRQELRWRMAIAEMPGNARDDMRIGRAELDQTLWLAGHHDDVARFQLEAVAINERRRISEIDEEFRALGARQRATATAAIVEIEFNRVDHAACIETAALKGLGRSDHDGHVSNSVGARTARRACSALSGRRNEKNLRH